MMKRPSPKPKRTLRQTLALGLCALLAAASLSLPASSASGEPQPNPAPEPPAAAPGPEETASPSPDITPDPDGTPDPDATPNPDSTPEPDATPNPDSTLEPDATPGPDQPPQQEYTVTFLLGEDQQVTVQLPAGQCLDPEDLPNPKDYAPQGHVFLGWAGPDGEPVDIANTPVHEDITFTALWKPWGVEALLNTEDHSAYANGFPNGTFQPGGKITRVQICSLLYNLLRDQTVEVRGFSDLDAGNWAAPAVSKMYELGVASGFPDGSFKPDRNLTRAELAKMAASLDVLEEDAECSFPDVAEDSWARPYIASAAAKGWMIGDNQGNFNPNATVTRAEAVTTLNRMLNRQPNDSLKAKAKVTNFYDLFPDNWAYCHIVEATTSHAYRRDEAGIEEWTEHTPDERPIKTGWLKDNGRTYYVGGSGKFLRGEHSLDGTTYLFDSTGAAATGFYKKGQWTRYYKDGRIVDDIANLGVVKGPYYIKVYKPANYVIVFAKDTAGEYTIPVRAMLCSCGEPTPTGTYYTPGKYRWLQMVGDSWAQWCTQILDSYLFHSVPNDLRNNYTMWASEFNNLGTTRSLGCIRLTCEDAKWMYDNCELGTQVYISPTETSGPLPKPTGLKLPGWHTWDPTDPTARWMCQERGCH